MASIRRLVKAAGFAARSMSLGIALSKTAHWLFDRGFWSISADFRVLVRAEHFEEAGDAGHLLKPRTGREILLPANRSYWPGREFLAWRRQAHGFDGA